MKPRKTSKTPLKALFFLNEWFIFNKMKLLSYILILHVLLLSAAPAWANVHFFKPGSHCTKSCCSSENCTEKHKSSKQNNCCKNGACNPFMICCNCYALTVQMSRIHVPFVYIPNYLIIRNQVFNSNFSSDTWHPPKAV